MLDWFNSILEFIIFLFIYFCICKSSIPRKKINYIIYLVLGSIASIYFTLAPSPILPLNISIYILILFVSFPQDSIKNRLLYAICSIPFMLIGEFMLHSLLPLSKIQTDHGNLVALCIFIFVTLLLLIYIRKKQLSAWISALFSRYFILILVFSVSLIILGQVYLMRLSVIWSYLPGLITLVLFSSFLCIIAIIIRYQRSTDRLKVNVLEKQISNSEAFILTMRTQLHDHKHHLQYLLDQIQTAEDLHSLQSETQQYLSDLEADRSFYDRLLAIQQPVFRAAIYGCYARCKESQIPFQLITSEMLPLFPLKDYELVEVIENLIENAIEHNRLLAPAERFIIVTMTTNEKQHRFAVENPAENLTLPLSELYLPGRTTKTGSHQGLGLASIRQILSENQIHFAGAHDTDAGTVRFEIMYEETT